MNMLKKFLVIAFCIFFANNTWGKTPLKVAVFPFTVNSREQLDYLQEGISDMLASRMEQDKEIITIDKHAIKAVLPAGEAKLDERLARVLGRQVGADFAVM
jgi:TolB-like protein